MSALHQTLTKLQFQSNMVVLINRKAWPTFCDESFIASAWLPAHGNDWGQTGASKDELFILFVTQTRAGMNSWGAVNKPCGYTQMHQGTLTCMLSFITVNQLCNHWFTVHSTPAVQQPHAGLSHTFYVRKNNTKPDDEGRSLCLDGGGWLTKGAEVVKQPGHRKRPE